MRCERDREAEFGVVAGEAGGQDIEQPWHEDFADDGDGAEPEDHDGGGFLGETGGGLQAFGVEDLGD